MSHIVSYASENRTIKLKSFIEKIIDSKYSLLTANEKIWSEEDVFLLADSLVKGYPVGKFTFITKELTPLMKIIVKTSSFYEDKEDNSDYIVIDGKQRMKALIQLYNPPKKDCFYYFDLLSMLYNQFPDEEIEKRHFTKNNYVSEDYIVNESLVSFDYSRDKECRYITFKDAVNFESSYKVYEFIKSISVDFATDAIVNKYRDFLVSQLANIGCCEININMLNKNTNEVALKRYLKNMGQKYK